MPEDELLRAFVILRDRGLLVNPEEAAAALGILGVINTTEYSTIKERLARRSTEPLGGNHAS